jgi:hypothetical protein
LLPPQQGQVITNTRTLKNVRTFRDAIPMTKDKMMAA